MKRKHICTDIDEFAVWNSNAIEEMKHHTDMVDFHVIAPYPFLKEEIVEWSEEGISYHIFRDHSFFSSFIQRNFLKILKLKHTHNRRAIKKFVRSINPDIIHLVGAENPYYSLCAMDVPLGTPLIVQLQTLLSEPGFEQKYTLNHQQYVYRSNIERQVIRKADYIGTKVEHFKKIIKNEIKPDGNFIDITLAVAERIVENKEARTNDFIYFAKDISKAADWAIEAFAFAYRKHPDIHLKIVGSYTPELKSQLDIRIKELRLEKAVIFTGMLPTHDDVINEVRKSKYALLPIKADIVTGTIREAMASSVPVITNVTPGTPLLNQDRESVLLSEAGDFESMALNMCRLVEDNDLYNALKKNALITVADRYNNRDAIIQWIEYYNKII